MMDPLLRAGLRLGSAYTPAEFRLPKPTPRSAAKSAHGAITLSCATAIADVIAPSADVISPGAAKSTSAGALRKMAIETSVKVRRTRVDTFSTRARPAGGERRARAAVMAEWKGPLIPPSMEMRKVGRMEA